MMKKLFFILLNILIIGLLFYSVSPEIMKSNLKSFIENIYDDFIATNKNLVSSSIMSFDHPDFYALNAAINGNTKEIRSNTMRFTDEEYITVIKLKILSISRNYDLPGVELEKISKLKEVTSKLELRYILINVASLLCLFCVVYAAVKYGVIGGIGFALFYSMLWAIMAFYFRGDISSGAAFLKELFIEFDQLKILPGLEKYYVLNKALYFKMLLIYPVFLFFYGIGIGLSSSKNKKKFEIELVKLKTENKKGAAQLKRLKNAEDEFKKAGEKIAKLSSRVISLQMLSQVLGASLNLESALDEVINTTGKLFGSKKCAIFLTDKRGQNLIVKKQKGYAVSDLNGMKLNLNDSSDNILKYVLKSGSLVTTDVAKKDFNINEMMKSTNVDVVMAAPLKHGEDKLGVLLVGDVENEKNIQEDGRLLLLLATLTALAIKNAQLHEKTVELANKDGLTKMYNNRYFNDFMDDFIKNAANSGRKISILMTDIDHFKSFNDTYGHQVGDFVLEQTAQVLINSARDNDLAARYGGEEFCLVMPDTDTQEAINIAERVRAATAAKKYKYKDGHLSVTVSIGVATFPDHTKSKKELIKFADDGLYMAKEGGRNQVRCAPKERGVQLDSVEEVQSSPNTAQNNNASDAGDDIFKF